MVEQEVKDEAAKRRIINHMNEDHHDSIIRYLEHYHGLPSWTAYSSRMINVDLNSMTFAAGVKGYQVPFNPPLSSYRETRERVVDMDKECLQALGKSDITVKEFIPPTVSAISAIMFLVIVSTFLGYSQRWWFAKGAIVERLLGSHFARFSYTIQPWLITFMVTLHSAEAIYIARNKLRKHSVNMRTSLWWKWTATTFIEGVFAFKRFNDHVERKRQDKEKQKH